MTYKFSHKEIIINSKPNNGVNKEIQLNRTKNLKLKKGHKQEVKKISKF